MIERENVFIYWQETTKIVRNWRGQRVVKPSWKWVALIVDGEEQIIYNKDLNLKKESDAFVKEYSRNSKITSSIIAPSIKVVGKTTKEVAKILDTLSWRRSLITVQSTVQLFEIFGEVFEHTSNPIKDLMLISQSIKVSVFPKRKLTNLKSFKRAILERTPKSTTIPPYQIFELLQDVDEAPFKIEGHLGDVRFVKLLYDFNEKVKRELW